MKRIFQFTDKEFREGKWCADRSIVPDSNFVELAYTARNGIMIVNNTEDFKVKSLNDKTETGERNGRGESKPVA